MTVLREFIGYLNNGLDIRKLLLTTLMALLAGVFLWFTGRVIHKKKKSMEREEAGRVLLPVLTAVTVFCTKSSLGIAIAGAVFVAALVMRYKKSEETEGEQTLFLLWGVAAGICIGERQYLAAAIMCVVVFVVFLVFHLVRNDSVMYLIIQGACERELEAEGLVFRVFERNAVMKSKKSDRSGFELIFEISEKQLRKAGQGNRDIAEMIRQIDGITSVQLTRDMNGDEK